MEWWQYVQELTAGPIPNSTLGCLQFTAEVICTVLVADFGSGLLHWLEDSYGRSNWLITGKLVTIPNIIHHHNPRYFTQHTWLKSAEVLLGLGAVILIAAASVNLVTWQVLLIVLLGINANEFHKWAHQSERERPKAATWLQNAGILQAPAHHAKHHRQYKDTYYCVLTNVLNPILEKLNFWRKLETSVFVLFGVQKREDTSLIGSSGDAAVYHVRQ